MGNIIEQLLFSASITGPICLMLALGVILKRTQVINENFIDVASKLVFNVTLPALLFLSIISSHHDLAASAPLNWLRPIGQSVVFYPFDLRDETIFP